MSNQVKSRVFLISVVLCVLFAGLLLREHRARVRAENSMDATSEMRRDVGTLDAYDIRVEDGRVVGRRGNIEVVFTIDPLIQLTAETLLKKNDPVAGAFVAIDGRTGAALAMATYARKRRDYFLDIPEGSSFLDPLLRNSNYPLASIVKIVTSSAAIEKGEARPSDSFQCAGHINVDGKHISDPVGEAHGNLTMADAFAFSCNPTFAAIALRVGDKNLEEYFGRYLFNRPIPFDLPLLESFAHVLPGKAHLGSTGAGFEGARVSPLHAALMAATMQNKGVMMRPYLVAEVKRDGKTIYKAEPRELARPVTKRTAEDISGMMEGTVGRGTARTGFKRGGLRDSAAAKVVGKTGSLNDNSAAENFTWFVGHLKQGEPRFAVATMIMNDPVWNIRAASFTGAFFNSYLNARKKNDR